MSRHARSVASPEISVVIAVRDDEERIGHQVNAVAAHLRALGRPFEIIAVNDGSRDNTLSMLELLAAKLTELRVVRVPATGRAFARGAAEANGTLLILMEASRSASLAPLGWALSRLAVASDVVIFRGRYIVARTRAVLSVIARAPGPGLSFERTFERRAQNLRLDVVGSRPPAQSATARLLAPVLRFLAAS